MTSDVSSFNFLLPTDDPQEGIVYSRLGPSNDPLVGRVDVSWEEEDELLANKTLHKMFGGSFFMAPSSEDYLTINLMAENPLPCNVYVPIRDFSVPSSPKQLLGVFEYIHDSKNPVYVGCFGGKGRTGLFMACYLKYLGYDNPIEMVRSQYNPHAVETGEQEEFVRQFPVRSAPAPAVPKSPLTP